MMATSGISGFDYLLTIGYLVAVVAIGLYVGRGQKSGNDYFLAGRSFGWFAISLSLIATVVSTSSYLGYPSEVYEHHLGVTTVYVFGLVPGLLVVQWVFVPVYRKLNVISIYEYVENRFGLGLRLLTAILFVVHRLTWMSVAVHSASLALSVMTGLPLVPMIFTLGLAAIAYAMLGGMKAVVWTDVIQFFIFFGGLVATVGLVVYRLDGGITELIQISYEAGKFEVFSGDFLSFDPRVRATLWGTVIHSFIATLALFGSDQLTVQRYLSARDERHARKSLWGSFIFGDIFLTAFQIGAGLALFAFYVSWPSLLPAGTEADQVFPHFVAHELPIGFPGLILAAMAAAIMSSIDSGVNSISAVLTIDFYRRFAKVKPSPSRELFFARALAPLIGLTICLLAAFVVGGSGKNIIERSIRANTFVVGPILGIFVLGIFLRWTNTSGTFVGAVVGVITGVGVAFGHQLGYWPKLSFQLAMPVSFIVTLAVGAMMSRLLTNRVRHVH